MQNILVIGAGYVGIPLIKCLREQGFRVNTTTTTPGRIETLKSIADEVVVLDPNHLIPLKSGIDWCDALVVLVAPHKGASYEETYLKTARDIHECIQERNRPLHIVYTGSTSVYEGVDAEWGTEELILSPPSEKGQILLETEKTFLNSGFDTCILRLGGIFGPGRDLSSRTHYFSGKKHESTGEEWTNHIHLEDIIKVIAFVLKNRLTGIYNVVNDDHPTRKELYGETCKKLGIPKPLWNDQSQCLYRGYKVSNQKIKGKFVTNQEMNKTNTQTPSSFIFKGVWA